MLTRSRRRKLNITFPPTPIVTGESKYLYNWHSLFATSETEEVINYGKLYNWYAVTDARNIFAPGWRLPYDTEFDGFTDHDEDLRETGTEHWTAPNSGATNLYKFNARGSGMRNRSDGVFYNLKSYGRYWCMPIDPELSGHDAAEFLISLSSAYITYTDFYKYGFSVRPVKETTTLADGEEGTYTGNDGRVYRTICIGTTEYLADNLAETRFRTGILTVFNAVYYTPSVAADGRNIANGEWRIPLNADVENLLLSVGAIKTGNTWRGGIEGFRLPDFISYEWDEDLQDYIYTPGTNTTGFSLKILPYISPVSQQFNVNYQRASFYYFSPGGLATFYFPEFDNTCVTNNVVPETMWYAAGRHIRLCRDAGDMLPGDTGTYTGNDGKVYPTICIGTREWMITELCESQWQTGENILEINEWSDFPVYDFDNNEWSESGVKEAAIIYHNFNESESFINDDIIPEVTDNAEWVALESAAMCDYNNDLANTITTAEVNKESEIITGFHLLTAAEMADIASALGGALVAGGKMKQAGTDEWASPNTGADNSSGFTAVAAGTRDNADGLFSGSRAEGKYWLAGEVDDNNAETFSMANDSAALTIDTGTGTNKGDGLAVRLAMDTPGDYTPGDTAQDADGNVYQLIAIGDIVVTASNLRATKYADGSPITLAQEVEEWTGAATAETGAYCQQQTDDSEPGWVLETGIYNNDAYWRNDAIYRNN